MIMATRISLIDALKTNRSRCECCRCKSHNTYAKSGRRFPADGLIAPRSAGETKPLNCIVSCTSSSKTPGYRSRFSYIRPYAMTSFKHAFWTCSLMIIEWPAFSLNAEDMESAGGKGKGEAGPHRVQSSPLSVPGPILQLLLIPLMRCGSLSHLAIQSLNSASVF